jgi:hypothetical protein
MVRFIFFLTESFSSLLPVVMSLLRFRNPNRSPGVGEGRPYFRWSVKKAACGWLLWGANWSAPLTERLERPRTASRSPSGRRRCQEILRASVSSSCYSVQPIGSFQSPPSLGGSGAVGQQSNDKPGSQRSVITIVLSFSLILHDFAKAHAHGDSGPVHWMEMAKRRGQTDSGQRLDESCGSRRVAHPG